MPTSSRNGRSLNFGDHLYQVGRGVVKSSRPCLTIPPKKRGEKRIGRIRNENKQGIIFKGNQAILGKA